MHVALTDGLAIQVLMDPGGVDLQLVTELWEDFARHVLKRDETAAGETPGVRQPPQSSPRSGPADRPLPRLSAPAPYRPRTLSTAASRTRSGGASPSSA